MDFPPPGSPDRFESVPPRCRVSLRRAQPAVATAARGDGYTFDGRAQAASSSGRLSIQELTGSDLGSVGCNCQLSTEVFKKIIGMHHKDLDALYSFTSCPVGVPLTPHALHALLDHNEEHVRRNTFIHALSFNRRNAPHYGALDWETGTLHAPISFHPGESFEEALAIHADREALKAHYHFKNLDAEDLTMLHFFSSEHAHSLAECVEVLGLDERTLRSRVRSFNRSLEHEGVPWRLQWLQALPGAAPGLCLLRIPQPEVSTELRLSEYL